MFLGFKGGKLIATGVGIITAISLPVGVLVMLIWLVVVGLTRFVSVGSITAVVSIPVLMMVYRLEWPYLVVGVSSQLLQYTNIFPISRG